MLNIAVCDDDAAELSNLKALVYAYFNEICVDFKLNEYQSGDNLLECYRDKGVRYDIILLDIIMTGETGIVVAEKIRNLDEYVKIIFVTSTPDYAVDSYDVRAYGYLLKPVEKQRIFALFNRYFSEMKKQNSITIRKGATHERLLAADIVYIESRARELYIYLKNGETRTCYGKLDSIEAEINSSSFLRCHKSFLVNMNYIARAKNEFITVFGHVVPIRQNGKTSIKERYFKYVLESNFI